MSKSDCAYLPTKQKSCADLPIQTLSEQLALIYHTLCADLPHNPRLSTGFNLRVYLFSQVAYNYIPVDLYPQPINQQNRAIRVTVYAPASLRSLGCRPNQRFGCHRDNLDYSKHNSFQDYREPKSQIFKIDRLESVVSDLSFLLATAHQEKLTRL